MKWGKNLWHEWQSQQSEIIPKHKNEDLKIKNTKGKRMKLSMADDHHVAEITPKNESNEEWIKDS